MPPWEIKIISCLQLWTTNVETVKYKRTLNIKDTITITRRDHDHILIFSIILFLDLVRLSNQKSMEEINIQEKPIAKHQNMKL